MKEAIFRLEATLKKGLALKHNVRNKPFLVQSLGAFPFEGVLQSVRQFTRIDTSPIEALGTLTFPYPQFFNLFDVMVICGPTSIWEYDGNNLVNKIDMLTEGYTWTVLDYKTFICLSNGVVTVTKSPTTGSYSISPVDDSGNNVYPLFLAGCDFKGQAVISPVFTQVTPPSPTPPSGDYLLDSNGDYVLDNDGNKIPLS